MLHQAHYGLDCGAGPPTGLQTGAAPGDFDAVIVVVGALLDPSPAAAGYTHPSHSLCTSGLLDLELRKR